MQNKGLIRLFAFLFGFASLYQLSFTFITNKIEGDAERYALVNVEDTEENYVEQREQVEAVYLDSVADLPVLGFSSYADAKTKELNKGLDLKGGINVTLQISVKDILKGLANNTSNPAFNKAIADADAASKSSDATYLELFFRPFEKLRGKGNLPHPEILQKKQQTKRLNFQIAKEK